MAHCGLYDEQDALLEVSLSPGRDYMARVVAADRSGDQEEADLLRQNPPEVNGEIERRFVTMALSQRFRKFDAATLSEEARVAYRRLYAAYRGKGSVPEIDDPGQPNQGL